ncbi:RidA family protein [candidate division KSB1 bacterium]
MKKIINSDQAPEPKGPYSHSVAAAGLLFVSGQGPINPETNQFELGDIKSQTRRTLENVAIVLKAAGLTMKDVVKSSVFLTDINDFNEMNEVYAEYFSEGKPARTTVEVAALPFGIKVEVDVVAALE